MSDPIASTSLIARNRVKQSWFLFLSNLVQLSELIRTGRLDFMLLLPINTRFVISLRQIDLGGFVNAGFALSVIFYAGHQLHLSVTVPQILGYLLLVGASLLVHEVVLKPI